MKLNKYYQFKIILIATLLSIDILCFTTEFENRMKERINISEGFMKHKKIQSQNLNAMYKTADTSSAVKSKTDAFNRLQNQNLNRNTNVNPNNLGIANTNEVFNLSEKQEPVAIDTNIGNGPIYATGWIKYFKYTPTSEMKNAMSKNPRTFIVNGQFKEQAKLFPNAILDTKVSDGLNELYLNIRNKFSFYAVLLKNDLNILTSRQSQIQQTFDNINIANLKNIVEVGGFPKGGGIEDFGNFSEGFCFKLNVAATLETYVICCDEQKTKVNFMSYIKKIKIKLQRDGGMVLTPSIKEEKDDMTIAGMLNPSKIDSNKSPRASVSAGGNVSVKIDPKKNNITDGYWIVLQNWSQCTLKCGGGKSYLQRMCVPPKNGGKPCVGEAIITRECNTHPCPKVGKSTELLKKNNTQILKPLVKIMPFSSRPQRYSKCVIKEGDLLYNKVLEEKDPMLSQSGGEKPADMDSVKIPVRLVMNNRTVTIFAGEDYDSHIETFILKKARFFRDAKSAECFIIKEESGDKQSHLCGFGDGKKAVEEWNYDFNLFKYQCNDKKPEYVMDEFQKKLQEKIKDVKKGLLDEVQEKVKIKAQLTEEMKLESKVKKTNKVALLAIQKELNLEELIKQEEAEREKREEQMMLKKIEEEKKKSDCLMKAIKEKQLENQFNLRQKETLEAISNIKKAAIQEVQVRRNNLKKIIEEMRQKQKRKTNGLSQKLQSVRYQMAQEMGKAYKKGDAGTCERIGYGNESKDKKQMRKNYCVANFSEDFVKYQDCLDGDDFCHMCCDNEFGEFYIGDRENCYKSSCKKLSAPEPEKQENGRWIWQSEIDNRNQ